MTYKPLFARTDDPAEDVPAWLEEPLGDWLDRFVPANDLRSASIRARVTSRSPDLGGFLFRDALAMGPSYALELIHAALSVSKEDDDKARHSTISAALEARLREGGSAWRVADGQGGLERRVSEPQLATHRKALAAAGAHQPSAADHLSKAWSHVYGRSPDPRAAYGEAVAAVEAAAKACTIPRDSRATLGKMIAAIRATPQKWSFAVRGMGGAELDGSAVVPMMELLWNGQTDRHGATPTIPVSLEAATAAVHLAATLVTWFSGGMVTRASP